MSDFVENVSAGDHPNRPIETRRLETSHIPHLNHLQVEATWQAIHLFQAVYCRRLYLYRELVCPGKVCLLNVFPELILSQQLRPLTLLGHQGLRRLC